MSKDPRQMDIEDYINSNQKTMNKTIDKEAAHNILSKKQIMNEDDYQLYRNKLLKDYLYLADYIPKTFKEYQEKYKVKSMTNNKNIGHNSSGNQLKQYIEGIENYENQKKDISESIKEIFDTAKSAGFDVKTMRKIIKLRKTDPAKAQEEQYLLETYCDSLQMDLFK